MRWVGLLITVTLAGIGGAGIVGGAGIATAAGGPVCGPASGHTVASDASARVYESGGHVFGCAKGHASYRLGNARFCNNTNLISPVRVAGTLAAYGDETCGVDTGSTTVIVRVLTNDRKIAEQSAITGPGLVESYTTVTSLVLKSTGAVAWIASERSVVGHGSKIEVESRVGKRFTLLDSGSTIAPASLRLRGSTLSWRDGSSVRTGHL